jgi:hypothetical protein
LPLLEVPELNTSIPELPDVPALTERIATMPLDDKDPSPELRLRAPPVLSVLLPAKD